MPVYTYVGNKHTGDGTSAFRVRDASSVVRDVAIGYAVDLAPSTYTALQALFNFSSGGTNMAPEASDDAPPSGGSGGGASAAGT
jgi:hypothetical protein